MNGWEFLAAYQQLPVTASRSAIALLSSSEHDLAQARARQLLVDAFLNKSLTREKLQTLLAQHFAA